MKRNIITILFLLIGATSAYSQEIQTIFRNNGTGHGGYGAITNKFTTINGEFANMCGIYGGWYINHKFLVGVSAAAVTNDIRVPQKYSVNPDIPMSYEFGQVGLVTEYVLGSNKAVHFAFNLFTGAGFTVQYDREGYGDEWEWHDDDDDSHHDENWFFVAEPGVQVEVNITRWMRFSPGVSYRIASGSDGLGLSDAKLSDMSYNLTLKFGKF
ncbi:hypothetical protein [Pseudochryseolinea flava]|uniref:Outer membrane protein beta-barrel domain-containing protein n=1 Tax=Pseudochryseolinea flava TaxID=2059302 RepID=A0A364Y6I2_9BACT|nr:hypothetical protein [Pseudochryseolinea flava]RAW01708.1 hypothetical protein DQQ10_08640 [Pseudochryseolinea flava]